MATPRPGGTVETSLAQDLLYAARYYLGGRRGLLILGGLAITAGVVSNWSWLVAAGAAPILVSVLPCLAMCALGLCMSRATGKSCSRAADNPDSAAIDNAAPTAPTPTLEALQEPVAGELPNIEGSASLTSVEPQTSRERSRTDV